MTMGEGGAVYTNNPLLHKIVNSYRDWGRDCWCVGGVDNTCPELNLRQLGDQEADIKRMVRPITKYCVTITDIKDVKYELDKAIYISLNGRPGPVWIDVPLDIQGAMVSEDEMRNFDPIEFNEDSIDHSKIDFQIEDLLYRITKAKSPVIYVGNGIRLAHRVDEFISLAESLQIPVVTAISGSDIIWYDHPLFYGRPGICGDRIGNIMVQNSDLLIILGTRLSIRQISYAYDLFAPKAYKVMVDVDASEMDKPTLSIDMKLHSGLSEFVDKFIDSAKTFKTPGFAEWRSWYQEFTSKIFKFSTLSLNKGEVHKALSVKSSSIYRIKLKNYDEAYYHLSRENADSMLERYLRYWRGERFSSEPLSVTSTWVIKKTIRYFLLNSIFFKGKAAIALAFSYLGYHMISYVYRWDYKYANADKIYSNIRENISNIWKRCD